MGGKGGGGRGLVFHYRSFTQISNLTQRNNLSLQPKYDHQTYFLWIKWETWITRSIGLYLSNTAAAGTALRSKIHKIGKWEPFRKGDVVMKWFSFTNMHPMRICGFCGFCYATQWRWQPWKRSKRWNVNLFWTNVLFWTNKRPNPSPWAWGTAQIDNLNAMAEKPKYFYVGLVLLFLGWIEPTLFPGPTQ
jgi:hypothetical protein